MRQKLSWLLVIVDSALRPLPRALVGRAIASGSFAGLIVVPLTLLLGEMVSDRIYVAETLLGALIGTTFFASTALVVMRYQNSPSLRTMVMSTYVSKTGLLFAAGSAVTLDSANRPLLAAATGGSAVAYLLVQTFMITRGHSRYRRSAL